MRICPISFPTSAAISSHPKKYFSRGAHPLQPYWVKSAPPPSMMLVKLKVYFDKKRWPDWFTEEVTAMPWDEAKRKGLSPYDIQNVEMVLWEKH